MLRYWWVILVVLGFVPAVLLTNVLLESVTTADWSCSTIEFGASGSQYGGCSTIAGELIVVVAISWIAPLCVLVALLYLLGRHRRGADDQAIRSEATGRDETAVDWTGVFVRVVAVLVGLANVIVIGDPLDVVGSPPSQPLAALFGNLLPAAVAGLLASELVLRIGRPALSGGFFARYGIVVLGLCLGGAILGCSSVALGLLAGQPAAQNAGGFDALLLWAVVAYGSIAVVVGGVMGALEGLILGPPLAAVLGKLGSPRDRARGSTLPSAALFGLLVVTAVVSYAVAPSRSSDTSPPAQAGLPPNGLPVSCPGGEEDRGYFNSFGDDATPDLLMSGTGWRYVYNSSGSGTFDMEVLDEDGNASPSSSVSGVAGDEGRSSWLEAEGTFSVKVNADETVGHTVLVCEKTEVRGRNKGTIS